MDKTTISVRPETRYRGVSAAARRCGVTPQHLSMCLHGTRKPGKALARRLKRLGIEVTAEAKGTGEGEGMREAGNA